MNADNSHAERQIAKRRAALDYALLTYDNAYAFCSDDMIARRLGALNLAQRDECDVLEAYEILADALALRAAAKQQPGG